MVSQKSRYYYPQAGDKMKKLSEYTSKEKEKMTHIEMGQITRKYYDSQKRILMARLIDNYKLEQEVAKNVVGL